jgi:hypothetical protein
VQFEPDIVDLLDLCVAQYPVGCMVRLNSREIGIVVDINQQERARPIIRVLYDRWGKRLQQFWELDLAKTRHLSIVEVVE